ncbi:type 1 glutamine amidotransferase [Paracoccus caeni]|uniref:Type 1 glutamine amidotransferase n=1 Tax=Paracoccus caeni TaxID=657651 RepID=A0A934SBJ2_9RHOB|nr:type 1 glutamine amidotransferase [Paracoccus caeni]MBK4215870.1 type 1 glutamine amidotransferase [Paracoccus caeni]
MRIGILQCGQSPAQLKDQLGDYPDMFVELLANRGFDFRIWHVEAMQFPDSIHDADGWLLTGSRHGAYEDHPFIPPLEAFIRDAYAEAVPLVGICFGHQIIAQALGGKVQKYAGGWAVGTQDYEFEGQQIRLNAWHQDQVVELPKDAQIIGRNLFCENAALIYGDRALTVQPHPEFGDAMVGGLMQYRAEGVVPAELLDVAKARMGETKESSLIADRIENFFKQPRARLADPAQQPNQGVA